MSFTMFWDAISNKHYCPKIKAYNNTNKKTKLWTCMMNLKDASEHTVFGIDVIGFPLFQCFHALISITSKCPV